MGLRPRVVPLARSRLPGNGVRKRRDTFMRRRTRRRPRRLHPFFSGRNPRLLCSRNRHTVNKVIEPSLPFFSWRPQWNKLSLSYRRVPSFAHRVCLQILRELTLARARYARANVGSSRPVAERVPSHRGRAVGAATEGRRSEVLRRGRTADYTASPTCSFSRRLR